MVPNLQLSVMLGNECWLRRQRPNARGRIL